MCLLVVCVRVVFPLSSTRSHKCFTAQFEAIVPHWKWLFTHACTVMGGPCDGDIHALVVSVGYHCDDNWVCWTFSSLPFPSLLIPVRPLPSRRHPLSRPFRFSFLFFSFLFFSFSLTLFSFSCSRGRDRKAHTKSKNLESKEALDLASGRWGTR